MLTRVDREHSHTIASVGELFAYLIPLALCSFGSSAKYQPEPEPKSIRDITNCSVCSFKQRLDRYLNSIPDLPCTPGYNNSLDGGDCLQRWTLRDDLVAG